MPVPSCVTRRRRRRGERPGFRGTVLGRGYDGLFFKFLNMSLESPSVLFLMGRTEKGPAQTSTYVHTHAHGEKERARRPSWKHQPKPELPRSQTLLSLELNLPVEQRFWETLRRRARRRFCSSAVRPCVAATLACTWRGSASRNLGRHTEGGLAAKRSLLQHHLKEQNASQQQPCAVGALIASGARAGMLCRCSGGAEGADARLMYSSVPSCASQQITAPGTVQHP